MKEHRTEVTLVTMAGNLAIMDMIKEMGTTSRDDVYASLMGVMKRSTFDQIIDNLKWLRFIEEDAGQILRWTHNETAEVFGV